MSQHQKPCIEIRSFPLRAAVWRNEGADGRQWYSIKLTKSYKDAQGKWQETSSLNDRDLLAASALLLNLWQRIAIKEGAPAAKADEEPNPF